MDDLPKLDIEEDIATLMSDDEGEKPDEKPLQDLTKPVEKKEPSEIFVSKPPSNKDPPELTSEPAVEEEPIKKPKAKKPRSKAQIEHLNKVRKKAVESVKQKKRDRLEIEKRVKEELAAKRKMERIKKKEDKIALEKEELPKPTPSATPSEKPTPTPIPVDDFNTFMGHMERFEKMKMDYLKQQEAKKPKPTINPPKPKPKPKAPAMPDQMNIVNPAPTNPYDSMFNW
tara:strand:- start:1714 stop:2397 length:684 start_codon:yes stop_codon:yes gene_type:complete